MRLKFLVTVNRAVPFTVFRANVFCTSIRNCITYAKNIAYAGIVMKANIIVNKNSPGAAVRPLLLRRTCLMLFSQELLQTISGVTDIHLP